MTNINNEKQHLIEKRDELRSRLLSIKEDYRRGLDADLDEQAIQLENAEVLDAIATSTAEELKAIELRLAKLD
jgi:hypothetical protein